MGRIFEDDGDDPFEFPDPVIAERDSGEALMLRIEGTNKKFWCPKSQIHDDSEVYEEGHEGTLVVRNWFAQKEGW